MNWTFERPRMTGWYWFRSSPDSAYEVVLALSPNLDPPHNGCPETVLAIGWQGTVGKRKLKVGVAQWAGPISEPISEGQNAYYQAVAAPSPQEKP